MSPPIITLLCVGAVLVLGMVGVAVWYIRQRQKEKTERGHFDGYFRIIWPEGAEQREVARPIVDQLVSDVDTVLGAYKRVEQIWASLRLSSPFATDLVLRQLTTTSDRISDLEGDRAKMSNAIDRAGLGQATFEEEEVKESQEPSAQRSSA